MVCNNFHKFAFHALETSVLHYRDYHRRLSRVVQKEKNSKHGLKKELADQFLKNLENIEEFTHENIRKAFPLKTLRVCAPIADFYKMYNVA